MTDPRNTILSQIDDVVLEREYQKVKGKHILLNGRLSKADFRYLHALGAERVRRQEVK